MLEDIGILTGGKMISEDLGIKLENVKWEDLGDARSSPSTRTTRRSSATRATRSGRKRSRAA